MRHILVAVSLVALVSLSADSALAAPARTPDAPVQDASMQQAPDTTLRPLTTEDYGRFERLGQTVLSPDGRWLSVQIRRVSEVDEVRLHEVAAAPATAAAAAGAQPGDEAYEPALTVAYGSGAAFSPDGQWYGVLEGIGEEEREQQQKQGKPYRATLVLVELATGDTTRIGEVARFAFSGDSRFVALRRYAPEGSRDFDGVDVLVRSLATGTTTLFGNISEHAWADQGAWLAMVVDAQGMAGNGVQLFDAANGRLRTLESQEARYSGLVWRDDASDLAVLRQLSRDADGEEVWADTAHVAIAFRSVEREGTAPLIAGPDELPAGMRLPSFTELSWADDGAWVQFGLDPREPAEATCEAEGDGESESDEDAADAECADEPEADDRPTLEIWHADDADIIPTQKVRANFDRQQTRAAIWHLDASQVVALDPTGRFEQIEVLEGTNVAIARDETPYDAERRFGPGRVDVWAVDLRSGEAELVLEGESSFEGASPDGRWLLTWDGTDFWSTDRTSGARTNLTSELGVGFTNTTIDLTIALKPAWGEGGWLDDASAVMLYDEFDAWLVAPNGSSARRVTEGRDEGIRHRRVWLDFDQPTVDRREAVYWALYRDATEEFGYGRSTRPAATAETLVFGPFNYGTLRKADDAEVFSYIVQSFEDSPDIFVGGAQLADARQVTRTNPFQSEYAWGRAELVDFQNVHGVPLQGSLYYPAGWEPGRQYPMIVYIYEKRAQDVRTYHVASQRDYYDFQAWVQEGYFVFQPDIVYRDRNPGISAREALEPAVATMLETGMIDPERVGLIGHSWGGYQTTFMATVSDVFSAAVAGAPLTNLFSMYLSIYWNTGGTDARIFEISQGRMEVPFWEDEASYRANSPVFHIETMNTPLLMAQGTEDGAVDFNQGVEFYNAARRADKDFVFLVYNGENHGFTREPNQRDYHRRIIEWFAHYLKGEPPADWIQQGVPYLDQLETSRGGR